MKTPEPGLFRSGRQFAAWIGLTPKDHSTAGKVRLGGITRAGDEGLRSVLVVRGRSRKSCPDSGTEFRNRKAKPYQRFGFVPNILISSVRPQHWSAVLDAIAGQGPSPAIFGEV
jgi:hypothetical protein